jgi:hypothetical protein
MSIVREALERKDIALTAAYTLGMLILSGAVSGQFFPARSDGGISFDHVVANLGGDTPETAFITVSVALLLVVVSGLLAYGSNRIYDELFGDGEFDIQSPETLALLGSVGLPVAHEAFDSIGEITTGSPVMQVIVVAVTVYSYVYIADVPEELR